MIGSNDYISEHLLGNNCLQFVYIFWGGGVQNVKIYNLLNVQIVDLLK